MNYTSLSDTAVFDVFIYQNDVYHPLVDSNHPTPYIELFASRRKDENQAFLYFKTHTNRVSSLNNAFFSHFDRTPIVVDGSTMPIMANISIDVNIYYDVEFQARNSKSVIEILQAVEGAISIDRLSVTNSLNSILISDSYTSSHVSISNSSMNGFIQFVPPVFFSWRGNLDLYCNMGSLQSSYVSSSDPALFLDLPYALPCEIYFHTDDDSQFAIWIQYVGGEWDSVVNITDVSNDQLTPSQTKYYPFEYYPFYNYQLHKYPLAESVFSSKTNKIRLTINNNDFTTKVRVKSAKVSKLLALNDFVSANSTFLFSNILGERNASISSTFPSNLKWNISNGFLNFYVKANTSSQFTFGSDLLSSKNESGNKIVGLEFLMLSSMPIQPGIGKAKINRKQMLMNTHWHY